MFDEKNTRCPRDVPDSNIYLDQHDFDIPCTKIFPLVRHLISHFYEISQKSKTFPEFHLIICFRYFYHSKSFALMIISNVIIVFVMIAMTRIIISVINDVAQSAE